MINGFQKIVYKLCSVVPICIFLAITFYTQKISIQICIFCGLVGVGGCVYAVLFIKLCEQNLSIVKITIDSVLQDDTSVCVCIASYLVPLVGIIWKNNLLCWIMVGGAIVLLLIKSENLGFSPILLVVGYHCYKVNLSTGTTCILISRRKGIRNKKQVNSAIRINENLMVEKNIHSIEYHGGKSGIKMLDC